MFNSKIRAGSPGAGALLRRAEEMDDEGIADEKKESGGPFGNIGSGVVT
jgi:hypothetical protein